MARIRTIKPEFPQSESMGRISRDARLLFILLWTLADDSGRARASSRMLASLLFPYDDDAPTHIGKWLDELETVGCIRRYVADDTTYLEIVKWLNHQKIDKPSPSRIPTFREGSRGLANVREGSRGLGEASVLGREASISDREASIRDANAEPPEKHPAGERLSPSGGNSNGSKKPKPLKTNDPRQNPREHSRGLANIREGSPNIREGSSGDLGSRTIGSGKGEVSANPAIESNFEKSAIAPVHARAHVNGSPHSGLKKIKSNGSGVSVAGVYDEQRARDEYAVSAIVPHLPGRDEGERWAIAMSAEDPKCPNHAKSVRTMLATAKRVGVGWVSPERRAKQ